MKKPKISAEVSQEEFEAYKAEAERRGMTLSEWLRLSLNSALPTTAAAGTASPPDVADAAFKQLDEQDATGGGTDSEWLARSQPNPLRPPLPPAPVQAAQPSFQKLPPAPVTEHPCVHLNPARPGILTSGECSGTCNAASQRGKPCFFAPMTAKKCPVFMNRIVPNAPVQDMRARK